MTTIRFGGYDRPSNAQLTRFRPGDPVHLVTLTIENGKPTALQDEVMVLGDIQGHRGETVNGIHVPAGAQSDNVDKVTLTDGKGQVRQVLLGYYKTPDQKLRDTGSLDRDNRPLNPFGDPQDVAKYVQLTTGHGVELLRMYLELPE